MPALPEDDCAGIGGFLFLNTLYLQDVRGLSPFHAGLYTLPMAGMLCLFAPLSGRVVGRRGARPSLLLLVLILGILTTTEWAKQTAQWTAKRVASPPHQLQASET